MKLSRKIMEYRINPLLDEVVRTAIQGISYGEHLTARRELIETVHDMMVALAYECASQEDENANE